MCLSSVRHIQLVLFSFSLAGIGTREVPECVVGTIIERPFFQNGTALCLDSSVSSSSHKQNPDAGTRQSMFLWLVDDLGGNSFFFPRAVPFPHFLPVVVELTARGLALSALMLPGAANGATFIKSCSILGGSSVPSICSSSEDLPPST